MRKPEPRPHAHQASVTSWVREPHTGASANKQPAWEEGAGPHHPREHLGSTEGQPEAGIHGDPHGGEQGPPRQHVRQNSRRNTQQEAPPQPVFTARTKSGNEPKRNTAGDTETGRLTRRRNRNGAERKAPNERRKPAARTHACGREPAADLEASTRPTVSPRDAAQRNPAVTFTEPRRKTTHTLVAAKAASENRSAHACQSAP